MSDHPTSFTGDVAAAIKKAIEDQVPSSRADVSGGGGHYNILVTSPVFAGKTMLESQRLVYGAIAHLMKGDDAPVHAVDSLKTRAEASSS
jgi:acid stress-induced BolA-like protein IbaG/YrbA